MKKKREKKKDSSLAINGWLTWGTKWIRVYGRSTTPRGQGRWGLGIGDRWGLWLVVSRPDVCLSVVGGDNRDCGQGRPSRSRRMATL